MNHPLRLPLLFLLLVSIVVVATTAVATARQDQSRTASGDQERANQQEEAEPDLRQILQELTEHMENGEFPAVAEGAAAALEIAPDDPALLLVLADFQFIACDINGAIATYDRIVGIDPSREPYLWQRGLALYYAKRFEEGKAQFETHQNVNSQDVENAIWHLLCASRIEPVEQAQEKLIPISEDTRPWAGAVYELFAGRLELKNLRLSAEIAGDADDSVKVNFYYTWLYAALFLEMQGESERTTELLRKADAIQPFPNRVLMGQIARIDLQLRGANESDQVDQPAGDEAADNERENSAEAESENPSGSGSGMKSPEEDNHSFDE